MWLSVVEVFASEIVILDFFKFQERPTWSDQWSLKLYDVWLDEFQPKHHQLFTRPSSTLVETFTSSLYTVGT